MLGLHREKRPTYKKEDSRKIRKATPRGRGPPGSRPGRPPQPLVMRTWHHQIRPLIIRCAHSYICIVVLGTIHLVQHVHAGNWMWVQICLKVQVHQSWTFSSLIARTMARPQNHRDILPLFLSGATASSRDCYSHLGPRPKLEHAPRRWRTPKTCPRTSFSLATTLGVKQGRPSQVGGPIHIKFESSSGSRTSL
jgi:hypothetical protein